MRRICTLPIRLASLRLVCFCAAAVLTAQVTACAAAADVPKKLLVVTVTKGFRHGDAIEVSEPILAEIGKKSGAFTVDYARTDAEMAAKMTPQALKGYDGVFFANTTGDLPLPDREAFLKWIADGHAFIGAHAATDTFNNWDPYTKMIGGRFAGHGPQVWVTALVDDQEHPATKYLGAARLVFDEIYLFRMYDRAQVHNLLSLDRHPNERTPGHYPVAWSKMHEKGRVFYTSLGHRPDVWRSPWYQQHLLGGIKWALGLEKGDATPQKTASKEGSAAAASGSPKGR